MAPKARNCLFHYEVYLNNNDRACILSSYFKHLGKDLGTEVCNNDQGNSSVVQVVMISESRRLQATLKTFGIQVGYFSEILEGI